jgi:hypothetical protein
VEKEMPIGGWITAKCKECNCRFNYYVQSWLFTDMEIFGTCDNCMKKVSHDCIDEIAISLGEEIKGFGRKEFADERKI